MRRGLSCVHMLQNSLMDWTEPAGSDRCCVVTFPSIWSRKFQKVLVFKYSNHFGFQHLLYLDLLRCLEQDLTYSPINGGCSWWFITVESVKSPNNKSKYIQVKHTFVFFGSFMVVSWDPRLTSSSHLKKLLSFTAPSSWTYHIYIYKPVYMYNNGPPTRWNL